MSGAIHAVSLPQTSSCTLSESPAAPPAVTGFKIPCHCGLGMQLLKYMRYCCPHMSGLRMHQRHPPPVVPALGAANRLLGRRAVWILPDLRSSTVNQHAYTHARPFPSRRHACNCTYACNLCRLLCAACPHARMHGCRRQQLSACQHFAAYFGF